MSLEILIGGGMGKGEDEPSSDMSADEVGEQLVEQLGKALASKDWAGAYRAFKQLCACSGYDEEEMN